VLPGLRGLLVLQVLRVLRQPTLILIAAILFGVAAFLF
jgi:hypothetical protein